MQYCNLLQCSSKRNSHCNSVTTYYCVRSKFNYWSELCVREMCNSNLQTNVVREFAQNVVGCQHKRLAISLTNFTVLQSNLINHSPRVRTYVTVLSLLLLGRCIPCTQLSARISYVTYNLCACGCLVFACLCLFTYFSPCISIHT